MTRYYPSRDEFARLGRPGELVPVYRQLTSDTLTPVSAYGRLQSGRASYLLESVVGGEQIGRYSFIGAEPFLLFEARGPQVFVTEAETGAVRAYECADPLLELQRLMTGYQAAQVRGLPRFFGGAVGYLGYDIVRYSEHLPRPPHDDRGLPDLSFGLYDRTLIFDQIRKVVYAVAVARVGADRNADYDRACARVDEMCQRLQRGVNDLQMTDIDLPGEQAGLEGWRSNFTRDEFEAAVRKCKEYIAAGDIFQVVISQRWQSETSARAIDVYRALRVVNPSPFMFLLRTPHVQLVGASPEVMVRVEDGWMTTRPLAGTRPRGATEEEDRRLAEELLRDPKERAEHIMLVDLARNDVGRVAEYGTVELGDLLHVERYSHVMHITSNVRGKLAAGRTAIDALRAAIPAGTVSGAPKIRAMQIIDEIEPHRRGPYAGAVGYVDFTGNMDTCITLRTLVLQGQTAYVQAGAGIVADSDPAAEFAETVSKARGMLKAIAIAERQL